MKTSIFHMHEGALLGLADTMCLQNKISLTFTSINHEFSSQMSWNAVYPDVIQYLIPKKLSYMPLQNG